ncbi:hypothetical protein CEXT_467311 [Caerostris extrusa]|uniref:Uncharacterized protein n=1 Tax=Caerostris extrusa TaxID=172846 RepID=A0AAV4NA19_CAEEX|nr:hypothetical protein CEXT_467311 [Caerostris extrusa]
MQKFIKPRVLEGNGSNLQKIDVLEKENLLPYKNKAAMKAEGDLPPVKEATVHQSAHDPKNTSGCTLQ